ncbi:MAG: NADH-quinone oxidoreductase subunit J [Anaerolineaceae bacterium]|nr:NADH-quinone oxidoreductase subunit J [Anaerolineaceae bacterium]
MTTLFYLAAAVALIATVMVITRLNAVHALLYMIVSLLALALVFYALGAPFVAALEVIIYAGAIMVLFVFVVMMLNLGAQTAAQEALWLSPRAWWGPALLALLLVGFLAYALWGDGRSLTTAVVPPKQVSLALFGPYLIGVELASFLLLAGLVGAHHLGRR